MEHANKKKKHQKERVRACGCVAVRWRCWACALQANSLRLLKVGHFLFFSVTHKKKNMQQAKKKKTKNRTTALCSESATVGEKRHNNKNRPSFSPFKEHEDTMLACLCLAVELGVGFEFCAALVVVYTLVLICSLL